MQDNGQIALAFAAWQRANRQLGEAEDKLAAATVAWKQGLRPRPDALQTQVAALKVEQDLRYIAATDALRKGRGTGSAPSAAAGPPGARGSFHPA